MKIRGNARGFTVVELIVAFAVLAILTAFFIVQRNDLQTSQSDQQRKIAINAMYYDLKDVYFAKNHYYPKTISRDNLTAMDANLFTDPNGYILNGDKCSDKNGNDATGLCNYHYTATNCKDNGQCQAFKVWSDMTAEATYSKSS